MIMKCKEFAKNAATLLFSILFCIAVAEIAFRIALQEEPKPIDLDRYFQRWFYMTHDSLLGWKHKPNSEGTIATPEYQTRIIINSNGVRGPEVSYAKAENERRVLILGDSFAEGYTVDLDQRFSNLLERQLNVTAKLRIGVINLGVGGYSSDQELLQFQYEGRKYQPDLVILLVYDNDIFYNTQDKYWRGSKPVFELAGTELVLTNTPVPQPEQQAKLLSARQSVEIQRTRLEAVKAWLNSNSRLYKFVRRVARNNYYLLSLAVNIGLTDEESLVGVPAEFNIYARSYDAQTSYAWKVTERIIQVLDDDVAKAGAELLIAYTPSSAAVYSEDWNATRRKYGMSSDEWNVHRVADELADICRRNGVPFLDLTSALQVAAVDLGRKGKRVYFEDNGHWTPEGNAHVAQALARFLKEHL
jgi:lysophospholipase L1-like esterase